MAARRVRWDCPSGAHPGVLGPTRSQAEATYRFCLACSADQGTLVRRVSPALERERAASQQQSTAKVRARNESDRTAARAKRYVDCLDADGSTGELDVKGTIERVTRLPAIVQAAREDRRRCLINEPVEFDLRRREELGCRGRAWPELRILLTIGRGCPRAQIEELILHEFVHYVLPPRTAHGPRFRTVLMASARQMFPGVKPRWISQRSSGPKASGHAAAVYAMDARIWREAWTLAGGDPTVGVDGWEEPVT